jgi:hypothetical protein
MLSSKKKKKKGKKNRQSRGSGIDFSGAKRAGYQERDVPVLQTRTRP